MKTATRRAWVGWAFAGTWIAVAAPSPTSAQVTRLVSVDSGGVLGNGASTWSSISADGRFVAFASAASNLVPGDTNAMQDIFVRDLVLGTIERASLSSGEEEGNQPSDRPVISADGSVVAFTSSSSNLAPGSPDVWTHVFVRDLQSGTTERVSVDSNETQANGLTWQRPAISGDGRYVVFSSHASNLVPGDTNSAYDIFLRDRVLGTTERVSVSTGGGQLNFSTASPSMSPDARYVAFEAFNVYVRDRQAGTTEMVSVAFDGGPQNGRCNEPSLSADGRYVGFSSDSTNLVAGDVNGVEDIFVRDRQLGVTELVSVDSGEVQGNDHCDSPMVSADGRFVAFVSGADNLVPVDNNVDADIFVRNLQSGTTARVSVGSGGEQGNGSSWDPSISADGRFVAMDSTASSLVPGDTNATSDIFVRDRVASGFTSLCSPGTDGVIACPCSNSPTSSGWGCNNSLGSGGAILAASGIAYLSTDQLVFITAGERPEALSILLQGNAVAPNGLVYGQGVRCAAGSLKRLFVKNAVGGSITVPDFGGGDPPVSERSAAKGDPIQPGQSRWYLVYYRDPIVLGGCPGSSTFNATQTGEISWWP